MINDQGGTLADQFIFPRSVAVVGVSSNENAFGTLYLRALINFGYKGKLYPVNPKGGSYLNLPAYPSVSDIPDNVDLAVISIPAKGVASVLDNCLQKGIRAAIILSGGFGETGNLGKKLEQDIAAIASKGIRFMGPNCFGVYCPASGLTLIPGSNFPRESGPIGLITQSGQFSEMIVQQTRGLGFRYSKVLSIGNARDLNECDFMEYLANDPDTKVILAYIEGVRQGRRFLEVIKKTSRVKPVLLWKVGMTGSGSKAASSHTGSLAGSEMVWNTFFNQTGAIRIDDFEDLIDVTIACLNVLPDCGRRVGVVSGSGGGAVTGADASEHAGLQLPTFSKELQQKIASYLPPVGTGVQNPVDLLNPVPPADVLGPILEAICSCDQVDTVILGRMFLSVSGPCLVLGYPESFQQGREGLAETPIRIQQKFSKPVIVTLSEEVTDPEMVGFEADRRTLRNYYLTHGVAVYPSIERAVKALAKVVRYKERMGK